MQNSQGVAYKRSNDQNGKNALYLSVNAFSTKVIDWGHYFYVSYWRRDRHFTWSSEVQQERGPGKRQYLHFSDILRP